MTPAQIGVVVAGTLAFAGVFLTVGRALADRAFAAFHRWGLPDPGAALTLLSVLGLVGGAITLKLGIHGLFGFFIVGIMAGEARSLSENTRHVISQMVRAVLVPLFFATLGLKIDFARHFDPWIVLFIMAVGVVGRFVGAWVGVMLTRQPRRHRHLIAVGHTPGGEMQIVIGTLAVEYNVISEPVFVAIVFGSVFSSIILGPWMKWALGRARIGPLVKGLSRRTTVAALKGTSREAVVSELCGLAGRRVHDALASAVLDRENVKGTAIGNGVATPHACASPVKEPVVAVGRSPAGLDWNAPDGGPVRLVFLTLAPAGATDRQLEIQRAVAALARDEHARGALLAAPNDEELWRALAHAAPAADDAGREAERR
jgi:mannitol/fructose-specific phosphotransferase system IIA component (Ntr-type)